MVKKKIVKKNALGRDILLVICVKILLTLGLWFMCFSTPITKPMLVQATAQHVF